MAPRIDLDRCDGCGICQDVCPGDILHLDRGALEIVRYPDECQHCDICRIECPAGAITIVFEWSMLQRPVDLRTSATGGERPTHA